VSALATDAVKAAPEPFNVRCADGRELAAHWFAASVYAASARRGALVISAGTGFPQTFYFKLAAYAAGRGYDALVYDYRGMGWSAPPDLAKETTRMSDWGLLDMRAALDTAAKRADGAPLATLGHSIGGQFLGLLANHALARAHVQVATSVGYWRWEHAPFRYLAWWFWHVHGPLMLATKGYVPTGGGWSGLPLPRGARGLIVDAGYSVRVIIADDPLGERYVDINFTDAPSLDYWVRGQLVEERVYGNIGEALKRIRAELPRYFSPPEKS